MIFLLLLPACSKKEKTKTSNQPSTTQSIFTISKIEPTNELDKAPNFYWDENNFYNISRNKITLINFWATWCGPCVKEIPDLIKIKEEFSEQDFEIIGVSIDRAISPVVEFSKNVGINYIVIHDPEAKLLEAFGGSVGIPTTYLVDKDGKIVRKYIGARPKEVFAADIKEILK